MTAVKSTRDADNIVTLTLDLPGRSMNVLNEHLMRPFGEEMEKALKDTSVKGVIITSGKEAFIAGADLEMIYAITDPQVVVDMVTQMHALLRAIEKCGRPVVAALNGTALGGGLEIALACHWRIAINDPKTKFGQPEVKLGIAPGYGGTQRLPRLVGKGIALQLILSAEMIDAQEAYRIGLVNKVVPAADLLVESEKMLRGILAMAPLAIRLCLEAVDQGIEMTLDEGLLLEANHFGLLAATHDMKEGTTAFLEKRPAHFEGR